MGKLEVFVEEFFKNLKCEVSWEEDVLMVDKIPKSFEDLFGKVSPYRLVFNDKKKGCEMVERGGRLIGAITKYLENAGKATLLRIDFDIDVETEIERRLSLKNCELMSFTKRHKNNFFSRFSFVTSLNYLNESEKVMSEIYFHRGKVVEGDLSGYSVVDGEDVKIDDRQVKLDYELAKSRVVDLIEEKKNSIASDLKKRVEQEVLRIREHYDRQLRELGGDLNKKLDRIREIELELRSCTSEEGGVLREKLVRLRNSLIKAGDDEVAWRVLREREETIKDAMHKYSLNVSRKLVNTTVIYYPVYSFRLCLSRNKSKKFIDVEYDPLTKDFSGLNCEVCGKNLNKVNLADCAHICCDECLGVCGECGGNFCLKCLERECFACGKKICRDCVKMCSECGRMVCSTHMRRDGVSGEDRCILCLRACMRCQGLSEDKFFGEARDGSKVCQKCLGEEKRGDIVKRVFLR